MRTLGRFVFSFAIAALGVETLVCAQFVDRSLGPGTRVIPVIPWLPAVPWVACLGGAVWVACGVGLLWKSVSRRAALGLGTLLLLCTVAIVLPQYVARIENISLRTAFFEALSLASLAWLQPDRGRVPLWLWLTGRYLVAVSLMVFGIDHLLDLVPIAGLLPAWIPWHVFWVAFFGIALVAAGLSLAFLRLHRAAAAAAGAMFALWIFTLHLPRVLGLYGIRGAPGNPNEWSSLLIAVALWGGLWTLSRADL